MKEVRIVVIGGGLSGLINSILLSRAGFGVTLFEKNRYPFHRVCGEYISKEVVPFLKQHDLHPEHFKPADIRMLEITSIKGDVLERPLDLGAFGLSRYVFDQFLIEKALASGVEVREGAVVKNITYKGTKFQIKVDNEGCEADLVIGAQGKRSSIDKNLKRTFLKKRSPYVGVKYHIKGSLRPEWISLHNFEGGYCGVNQIEDNKFNLCYLIHRDVVRKYKSIQACEEQVLCRNPFLREIYQTCEFLFEEPLVINEVAFSAKGLRQNGVLFSGDAAGTIAPFSGNGMAMAIRSAKYLSESIIANRKTLDHDKIYREYSHLWKAEFAHRISRGRKIQRLFGNPKISDLSIRSGNALPFLIDPILKMTHGQPFK